MAYTVFQHDPNFGPRVGLEGPFHYPSGAVLYYDAKAGEYYDPRTDWFVPQDEVDMLKNSIFNAVCGK